MANRFWVGGSGNWDASSTTNWSATSGGVGGASVPTSVDSVFVDASSGTSPVITITATANCLDLNFTGAITPTLTGASFGLQIYGNLTLIFAMTNSLPNTWTFKSTSTGKTITTNGCAMAGGITFDGVGGGWTLQDNLTMLTKTLTITNGTLNTNGKTVNCGTFSSSNSNTRTITFGSSILNITGSWVTATTTGLAFNANTSTINMVSSLVARSFDGGGLTYYNVNFGNTAQIYTIIGSNTFNVLGLLPIGSLKLTSGTTQTVTSLAFNGTIASPITLQSTSSGSAATISKSSGVTAIRNISLKDIAATGGATFYALGTTNVSGNTGWSYQMLIKQEKLSGTEMALYHIDSNGVMQKVSG